MKCLMLQKMMKSPVEKENTTKCMETMVSKTVLSPSQSSPTVILFYNNYLNFYPNKLFGVGT